mmetsp:Transcript_2927/g.7641  ORF Transcript_2927/g.7641 Transcript_2927/m.7641 type:complete len:277 (-) Transcript_2927:2463-3293(-)
MQVQAAAAAQESWACSREKALTGAARHRSSPVLPQLIGGKVQGSRTVQLQHSTAQGSKTGAWTPHRAAQALCIQVCSPRPPRYLETGAHQFYSPHLPPPPPPCWSFLQSCCVRRLENCRRLTCPHPRIGPKWLRRQRTAGKKCPLTRVAVGSPESVKPTRLPSMTRLLEALKRTTGQQLSTRMNASKGSAAQEHLTQRHPRNFWMQCKTCRRIGLTLSHPFGGERLCRGHPLRNLPLLRTADILTQIRQSSRQQDPKSGRCRARHLVIESLTLQRC